jgi:hypothetical protein
MLDKTYQAGVVGRFQQENAMPENKPVEPDPDNAGVGND